MLILVLFNIIFGHKIGLIGCIWREFITWGDHLHDERDYFFGWRQMAFFVIRETSENGLRGRQFHFFKNTSFAFKYNLESHLRIM